ncbi:hypothetical protein ASF64_13060 [Arthrobacter sp. Leaf137]|nr:hypothetical protein ASF64_13060 [Arthrobacter sp. Leaf137]
MQLVGAVLLFLTTLVFLPFVSGFEFVGPSDQCHEQGCWPRPFQELLIAVPSLCTALAMGVIAFSGNRLHQWKRALVPSGIYAVLALIQHATWHPFIIPFLSGPSPLGP